MKKFTAIILAAILLTLTASTALAKTVYDPDKMHFIIVAADEETKETYVAEVTYKTVLKRVAANLVYEVYLLEADGLIPLSFTVDAYGTVTLTSNITGETIAQ